jgi:hypothetical protein
VPTGKRCVTQAITQAMLARTTVTVG